MRTFYSCLFLILMSTYTIAQERINGLIIKDYGATFEVPHKDIKTDTNATLKVIFDVAQTSEDKSNQTNRS